MQVNLIQITPFLKIQTTFLQTEWMGIELLITLVPVLVSYFTQEKFREDAIEALKSILEKQIEDKVFKVQVLSQIEIVRAVSDLGINFVINLFHPAVHAFNSPH